MHTKKMSVDQEQIVGESLQHKDQSSELEEFQIQELRQTQVIVEEYLHVISHELKSPLVQIDLLAKFIEEDNFGNLHSKSASDLQSIRKTCKEAIEMFKNFIEYSRANNSIINRKILDMTNLVRECFDKNTRANRDRQILLELDELPSIIGDEALINQMIYNILSNSVKFSQNTTNSKIKVYSFEETEYVNFCFEDNGVGFDTKYASNIFNVFERIHSEDEFNGHGVGLATVKRIAERFGGSVQIFGRVNQGCTLTVRFPKSIVISLESQRIIDKKKKDKCRTTIHIGQR